MAMHMHVHEGNTNANINEYINYACQAGGCQREWRTIDINISNKSLDANINVGFRWGRHICAPAALVFMGRGGRFSVQIHGWLWGGGRSQIHGRGDRAHIHGLKRRELDLRLMGLTLRQNSIKIQWCWVHTKVTWILKNYSYVHKNIS